MTNRSYVVDVVERLANTAATLGEISRSEDSEHRIVLADFSAEAGGVALLAQTDRLDEMLAPLDGRLICGNDHSRHFNVESLVDLRRPNEVEDRHRDQDHHYQAAQYDAYPFEYSFHPIQPFPPAHSCQSAADVSGPCAADFPTPVERSHGTHISRGKGSPEVMPTAWLLKAGDRRVAGLLTTTVEDLSLGLSFRP